MVRQICRATSIINSQGKANNAVSWVIPNIGLKPSPCRRVARQLIIQLFTTTSATRRVENLLQHTSSLCGKGWRVGMFTRTQTMREKRQSVTLKGGLRFYGRLVRTLYVSSNRPHPQLIWCTIIFHKLSKEIPGSPSRQKSGILTFKDSKK